MNITLKTRIIIVVFAAFYVISASAQSHKSYISAADKGLPNNCTAFLFSNTNKFEGFTNPALNIIKNKTSKSTSVENVNLVSVTSTSETMENICMYPNATEDELWVQLNNSTLQDKNVNIEIYNVTGDRIYFSKMQSGLHKINVCDFTAGIFMVKLGDNVQKIIIE